MAAGAPLLSVQGLTVEFPTTDGWIPVVEDVSFEVRSGEVVGLVGETGSGKTVSALAVMGLIKAHGGRVARGSIRLDGLELTDLSPQRLRRIRGAQIAMVFQQAMRSLNPALSVGEQVAETIRCHESIDGRAAWKRAVAMLDRVHIPKADQRAHDYPHQFSGGMCQRVMIAMALACSPKLLIADEPTTALDVTVQRRILDLLLEIQSETGIGILFISHDLGLIAELCDRVMVMYAGEIVEDAPSVGMFTSPRHPYTQGLLDSVPQGRTHRLLAIPGTVPASGDYPPGCRFAPRCAYAVTGLCDTAHPDLDGMDGARRVRCVRADAIQLAGIGAA
jgi:peptide/nickel transport system ATP-binding protein